ATSASRSSDAWAPAVRGPRRRRHGRSKRGRRATVRAFARAGAAVAILDVDGAAAERLAAELPAGRVLALAVDVADEEAVREAVERVVDSFGRLDAMHVNADIGISRRIADLDGAEWRR